MVLTFLALLLPFSQGKGYSLQYSGLENSMDCIVHGVAKSWTQLSDFHFSFSDCFSLTLNDFTLFPSVTPKYECI